MDQPFPRKMEQRIGSLESFRTTPGDCFARVRIGKRVFNLPLSARGVLQADGKTIVHCVNGSRYEPIAAKQIVVDLVYDANGNNPVPGLWAPKTSAGRCE